MMVRQRLSAMPGVDVPGADMFIVPDFLTRRDCKAIAQVINSRAVPSTLYRGADGRACAPALRIISTATIR